MRKSTREKIREFQREEQMWQRDRQAAMSVAEREHKDDAELKTLLAEREKLVDRKMELEGETKKNRNQLGRVGLKIQEYLEPYIPEEFREEESG